MFEMKYVRIYPGFKVELAKSDPTVESVAKKVGAALARLSPPPHQIDKYIAPTSVNSMFNPSDLAKGSMDYGIGESGDKLFFYRAPRIEIDKTALLPEGIAVPEYLGVIETLVSGETYIMGQVYSPGINLSYFRHCDQKPTHYYGTINVLDEAAAMLAKIHRNGFIHGNFGIDRLIISANPTRLTLYGNSTLDTASGDKVKQNDIDSFLSSLQTYSPYCPHKAHVTHFMDAYNRLMKRKG